LTPPELFELFPRSLLSHFFCDIVRSVNFVRDAGPSSDVPVAGSSAGSAEAVLVKTFRTRNASMGEKSSDPPSGGIIPRNMFKYGSHKVLNENMIIRNMYR
jgi:hypothetical protein